MSAVDIVFTVLFVLLAAVLAYSLGRGDPIMAAYLLQRRDDALKFRAMAANSIAVAAKAKFEGDEDMARHFKESAIFWAEMAEEAEAFVKKNGPKERA